MGPHREGNRDPAGVRRRCADLERRRFTNMTIFQSHAVWAAALSAVLPAAAALAQAAASYPSRASTLVVPYTPGSGIDILARVIAPELNRRWGEPVVVDNKPGASG